MEKTLLESFAEVLRAQRGGYLREFRKAEQGLEAIAEERESELEEHAQEEQSAVFLTRLDDRTLRAVKEIDAALQKILDGTYGVCESCHGAIAIARLRFLPATRFCKSCAEENEKAAPAVAAAITTPKTAPVPPDLSLLDDGELVETIREHLREDGRVDLNELRVMCRRGVVHLDGHLPSETEHQILLNTLTDVLGLKEIADRLEVEELLWENDRRTRELPPEEQPPWQEEPGTEDIVESLEEGKEFVAPSKPTPEER